MNIKELISEKYIEYDAMVANAICMLKDAKVVGCNCSKDTLLSAAILKLNEAVALRKEIAKVAGKYLIPSPSAIDIDVRQSLKEVGLNDMDDPAYGRILSYREIIGDPSPVDSPTNDAHLDEHLDAASNADEEVANKPKKRGRLPKKDKKTE